MKKTLTVLSYICLSAVGLVLLAGIGSWWWMSAPNYLPPAQRVRQQFELHRMDFIRFAELLQKDQAARYVSREGKVDLDGSRARLVPDYRELMSKIEAEAVIVREDGSMEFELWGSGCAICSDSYMGVRDSPQDRKIDSNPDWTPTLVNSLDSATLPKEKGAVATGLYVMPIEPNWFVYRLEYQE